MKEYLASDLAYDLNGEKISLSIICLHEHTKKEDTRLELFACIDYCILKEWLFWICFICFQIYNFTKPIILPPQKQIVPFVLRFRTSPETLHFKTILSLHTNASVFEVELVVYNGQLKVWNPIVLNLQLTMGSVCFIFCLVIVVGFWSLVILYKYYDFNKACLCEKIY